jgi:outer membrane immunogenic protein
LSDPPNTDLHRLGTLHLSSPVVCRPDRTGVGHAANDWLFYAKAGGAWMRVRYTEDLLTTAGGVTAATQVITDNRTGFTVGAGIEFGLVENLSAKIEYDFYDFGSKNYNFSSITPVSVSSNLHTIIVGLNYRFNWSGGPKP